MNSMIGRDDCSTRGSVARAWFSLTGRERKWVLLVLALVILGLAARYLHLSRESVDIHDTPPPGGRTRDGN